MQQRDAFLTEVYKEAKRDPNVVILSADFGAPALDVFRQDLPDQFIHCGISEQNAVNVAVGLARSGKRPYLYWMAPFFLRCAEQLKLAAFHGVPITAVPVGAGLSYAGSGPTHYATEDIAFYRTLVGAEVYTCSTPKQAEGVARATFTAKGMTVVRLERGDFPDIYEHPHISQGFELDEKLGVPYLACGYLVHRLRALSHRVCDVFRQKPISPILAVELAEFEQVYCVEEQYSQGGLGSAILEAMNDIGSKTQLIRRCLPERPLYANGNRDELFPL